MSNKILVETSARHIHVSAEAFAVLYGPEATLTKKKDLSQPGQYACEERLHVEGPKNTMKNVSILGPFRSACQVEVSKTDARTLGIDAVIRESGDIAGTPGCTLVGPCGSVTLEEGVIVAKRHIHVNPEQAAELNVADKEVVSVKVETDGRSLTFGDVVVRVNPNFEAAMHIDTDEANAANLSFGSYGTVIKD